MKKRLLSLLLALLFVLPLCVRAEGDAWTCPGCGQEGNTGNFCSNCATPRPSAEWTCPNCGLEGNTGNYCTNCATPRPDGTAAEAADAAEVNPALEQIPGETDRVKVIVFQTEASAYIEQKQNPDRWIPEHATDGVESTCWQFSAKKHGLKGKTWIELSFNNAQAVDELWFKNGFWGYNTSGDDQYPLNARLKEIKVAFRLEGENKYGDAVKYTLADDRTAWQVIDTGHQEGVMQIRISAVSSYQGTKFPNDVCLSEVMAVLHAPAESAMPPQEAGNEVVYESRPDITGCTLKMKISGRTGPGTQFADAGTFFQKNWKEQRVLVLKKRNDGSMWWVQVDFRNGQKKKYRIWTGAEKRVNVDLSLVKEEARICDCDIYPTSDTRYGPGKEYQESKITINRSAVGTIFGKENGWVDVEFWYEDDGFDGTTQRIWIPESAVYNLYYGDYSGE